MVKDTLRLELRFCVGLNASFDENREDDEMVFPEDDGRIETDLSDLEVVKLLCRDEAVPQGPEQRTISQVWWRDLPAI